MKTALALALLLVITLIWVGAMAAVWSGDAPHCREDEYAVHGGLENYYDPDAPLECVNIDEFEERWR